MSLAPLKSLGFELVMKWTAPWLERHMTCWFVIAILVVTLGSVPSHAQDRQSVDLELALLVDVSASVSDEEFRLQANGLAAALLSVPVLEAIRASARNGVAISVIQWANAANQRVSEDWTLIRGEDDARWLAARIASMPRLIHGGHTALSNALAFATEKLEENRFDGLRRVIDLSGDGRNNDGLPLRKVRREVIERDITINGLAILNELPLLDDYFRDHLIGGNGAFVIVAQDYDDFARAMIEKLDREIRSIPLADIEAPIRLTGNHSPSGLFAD
jgi:hypothetical protein